MKGTAAALIALLLLTLAALACGDSEPESAPTTEPATTASPTAPTAPPPPSPAPATAATPVPAATATPTAIEAPTPSPSPTPTPAATAETIEAPTCPTDPLPSLSVEDMTITELAPGEPVTWTGDFHLDVETGIVRQVSLTAYQVAVRGLRFREVRAGDVSWLCDTFSGHTYRLPPGLRPLGGLLEAHVSAVTWGEGFGVIGTGTHETCRVVRYDWAGAVLSDASFECAFDIETQAPWQGPYLSPDGRLVAANTLTQEFSDSPVIGSAQRLTAISVFDAVTGEELFRVKGAYWQSVTSGSFYTFVAPATFWIADSSGLVVGTRRSNLIVNASGHWASLPSALWAAYWVPSPEEPARFLLDPFTVADQEGTVVASVGVDRDSLCEPETGHPAVYGQWGFTNRDVFFSLYCQGATSLTSLRSILPPVIEHPPFEQRLLLEVATGGLCLNIRQEPSVNSRSVICLANGLTVEAIEHNGVYGDCSMASSCVWLYVRTDDGAEGWALSDYLRWARGEPAPSPTPTPTVAEYPTIEFREVPTKDVFDVVLAPGEPITQTGAYFLDVETGIVRGVSAVEVETSAYVSMPSRRFVALYHSTDWQETVTPYLYDIRSGRAFTWDRRAMRLIGNFSSAGEWLIFQWVGERAGWTDDLYVVADGDLEPVRWFSLPSTERGGGLRAWANPAASRLLLADSASFHIVGLEDEQVVTFEPRGDASGVTRSNDNDWRYEPHLFAAGEGFALIGRDEDADHTCRVIRYDWGAVTLSDVKTPCAIQEWGTPWSAPSLSPDGTAVVSSTLPKGIQGAPGGPTELSVVAIFDARTGKERFRIKGALEPAWLPGNSGLVVDSIHGLQAASVDGQWTPLPPGVSGQRFLAGPEEPLRFLVGAKGTHLRMVVGRGDEPFLVGGGTYSLTVVDRDGALLASLTSAVTLEEELMGEYVGIDSEAAWGATNGIVLFRSKRYGPRDGLVLESLLPPVIERPPFSGLLELRVATGGGCLNLREEWRTDAAVVTCLPDGALVEAAGYGAPWSGPDSHTAGSESGCAEPWCVWLYVRTDDGAEGWALSDYLRWARGEPAP